jgi:DNA-binding transcriptional regulator GbsR (MarR family)
MQLIEEFGIVTEARGMPRMAGRILGRLLMCSPPHQSLSRLAEDVQASKGSVSTMTRLLIQRNILERVTFPGDRQDYVRVRNGSIGEVFTDTASHAERQALLLERALAVADDRSPEGLARLRDAYDFFSFMKDEFPALLERWQARHSRHADAATHTAARLNADDPTTRTKEDE